MSENKKSLDEILRETLYGTHEGDRDFKKIKLRKKITRDIAISTLFFVVGTVGYMYHRLSGPSDTDKYINLEYTQKSNEQRIPENSGASSDITEITKTQGNHSLPMSIIIHEEGKDITKVVDIDTSNWGYSISNPVTNVDHDLYEKLNDSELSDATEKSAIKNLRKSDGKYVAIKQGKSLPLTFDTKMPNGIKEIHVIPTNPENAKYRVQALYKTENGGYAVSCDQMVSGEFKKIIEGPIDEILVISESDIPLKIERITAFYNKSGFMEKHASYTSPKKDQTKTNSIEKK